MTVYKSHIISQETLIKILRYYTKAEVFKRKHRAFDAPADNHWTAINQIVFHTQYREEPIGLAHAHLMAENFSVRKTRFQ